MTLHLVLSLTVVAAGLGVVLAAIVQRRTSVDLVAALADDDHPVETDTWRTELQAPVTTRLFQPLVERATGAVRRLAPTSRLATVRQRLQLAGLAGRLSAEEYLALQWLLGAVGALGAAVLWDGTPRGMALCGLLVFAALAAPRALVDNRRTQRVERVQRELPDVLDLLAICVEAGQGLEGAMRTVSLRGDGVLAAEFRHTLREGELGVSRRAALEHLRDRLEVPDVGALVAALIQADVLGNPIGGVLKVQAHEQRRRRRAQVREQAAKLPVKMLFPLVALILPALFVVVLGPAAMSIFEVLGR